MPAAPSLALDVLLAELHGALTALYGRRLHRLVLFGSHARGQAHPGSDVDVLVVLDEDTVRPHREINRIAEVSYPLALRFGVHISAFPLSRSDFEQKRSPLLLNVRREGIPVHVDE